MEEETNDVVVHNTNNVKKLNKKLIIVIALVLVVILGVFLVLFEDKIFSDNNSSNYYKEGATEVKEEKVKQEVRNMVITKDNGFGLYFDEELKTGGANGELVSFALRRYILDNNLKVGYLGNSNGKYDVSKALKINGDDISKYMDNLYSSKVYVDNYEYIPLYYDSVGAVYQGGNYYVGARPSSGDNYYIVREEEKIEKKDDMIYLYEKALICSNGQGSYPCLVSFGGKSLPVSDSEKEQYMKEAKKKNLTGSSLLKYLTEEVFKKYSKYLYTYEHTFKVTSDGTYLYSGTKVVNRPNIEVKVDENTLVRSLVSENSNFGLYFEKGVNVSDKNNKTLVTFNLINYIKDNSLKLPNMDATNYSKGTSIKRSSLVSYMNNKYNNEVSYVTNKGDVLSLYNSSYVGVLSDNDTYKVGSLPSSGDEYLVARKTLKTDKDGEYVYLYDKALICHSSQGSVSCIRSFDSKNVFVGINSDNWKNKVNNLLDEKMELLYTYKHTFKLSGNAYYYVSSEVVDKPVVDSYNVDDLVKSGRLVLDVDMDGALMYSYGKESNFDEDRESYYEISYKLENNKLNYTSCKYHKFDSDEDVSCNVKTNIDEAKIKVLYSRNSAGGAMAVNTLVIDSDGILYKLDNGGESCKYSCGEEICTMRSCIDKKSDELVFSKVDTDKKFINIYKYDTGDTLADSSKVYKRYIETTDHKLYELFNTYDSDNIIGKEFDK